MKTKNPTRTPLPGDAAPPAGTPSQTAKANQKRKAARKTGKKKATKKASTPKPAPPKADPPKEIDPTALDPAEAKKRVGVIYKLEKAVEKARAAHDLAKRAAKAAKDKLTGAEGALEKEIRDQRYGPGPLYDPNKNAGNPPTK